MTPLERDWLYTELTSLREQLTEQHQRIRSDMTGGFEKLRHELNLHSAEDRIVADRVLMIETQRRVEAAQAIRLGTWAGILAAAGLTGAVEVLKYYMTGHIR